MTDESIRIFPLGESALTVEFGDSVSVELNRRSVALAEHFLKQPFRGFIECVPAYASTTIFYNVAEVEAGEFATVFDRVKELVVNAIAGMPLLPSDAGRTVEIPVHFDAESALDLEFVARHNDLSQKQVIDIFTARTYRVFMLGFLPGFAYMAEVDDRIATPRRETPRTIVPKGSVGIAGGQTGIYSLRCPGGWQIIGRTDVELFTPDEEGLCHLRSGDAVKFTEAK